MEVLEAMRRRASTRAYLDKPVDHATIESILEAARWAPSGVNAQPWQVAVVTGETKRRISEALLAERTAGHPEQPDYTYYPKQWNEPYKSRRMACGLALYSALGINYNTTRTDDPQGVGFEYVPATPAGPAQPILELF